MNKFTKLAIVAAGAALAIQGAFAAGNDLILSINNNSGSPAGNTEFTVDLGNVTTLTGANQDLSSFMSTFNSQYASAGASGLNVGIIAGRNGVGLQGVGNDVFTTTLRASGGSYTAPGSTAPGSSPVPSIISSAGSIAKGFSAFGPNQSTADPSFTSLVAKDPTTEGTDGNASYVGYLGTADDPLQTMTGSSLVLDFWKDTTTGTGANVSSTSGWVYQGNFTLDLSGAEPSLVWDAAPVPEPSTYGLFAGAGILALSLRRQLRRKSA